jgi:hypothetical protein
VIVLASGFTAACGDDDDASKPAAGSGGASAGNGGRGGSGGTGGAAGGAVVIEPVQCGSSVCSPPANLLTQLGPLIAGLGVTLPMSYPCCTDESLGTCGVAAAIGATCEPPAVPDSRCPGLSLGAIPGAAALGGGAAMTGCCVDNACGLDGAIFGRGCVENSQAQSMISAIPVIGTLIMFAPSQACDKPLDTDAGTEDAG